MKILVVIAGVNRSFDFTANSINRKILQPLKTIPGVELQTSVHLCQNGAVSNTRSREEGTLRETWPNSFPADEILTYDLPTLRQQAQKILADVGPVSDPWGDSGQSLENSLTFICLLDEVAKSVNRYQPDMVVFTRPDLRVLSRLRLDPDYVQRPDKVLVPNWGNFGGVNDRFAVMPMHFTTTYFSRIEPFLASYKDSGGAYHAESFLLKLFGSNSIEPRLDIRLARIRLGGRIERRDLYLFLPPRIREKWPGRQIIRALNRLIRLGSR